MPGEVSFKNAFRARKAQYGSGCEDLRKPLPQMFTFVARTALPDSGQGLALRERVPHFLRAGDHGSSEDDVFCLVKEAMSSRSLSQDPLLVFPANLVPASQKFPADANSEGCPLRTWRLDGERWDELKAIRGALRNDFPHGQGSQMVRTVSSQSSATARCSGSSSAIFLEECVCSSTRLARFSVGAKTTCAKALRAASGFSQGFGTLELGWQKKIMFDSVLQLRVVLCCQFKLIQFGGFNHESFIFISFSAG